VGQVRVGDRLLVRLAGRRRAVGCAQSDVRACVSPGCAPAGKPGLGVNGDVQFAISVDATDGWILTTHDRARINGMVQVDNVYTPVDATGQPRSPSRSITSVKFAYSTGRAPCPG
jgi:hypothetical protein